MRVLAVVLLVMLAGCSGNHVRDARETEAPLQSADVGFDRQPRGTANFTVVHTGSLMAGHPEIGGRPCGERSSGYMWTRFDVELLHPIDAGENATIDSILFHARHEAPVGPLAWRQWSMLGPKGDHVASMEGRGYTTGGYVGGGVLARGEPLPWGDYTATVRMCAATPHDYTFRATVSFR